MVLPVMNVMVLCVVVAVVPSEVDVLVLVSDIAAISWEREVRGEGPGVGADRTGGAVAAARLCGTRRRRGGKVIGGAEPQLRRSQSWLPGCCWLTWQRSRRERHCSSSPGTCRA